MDRKRRNSNDTLCVSCWKSAHDNAIYHKPEVWKVNM